jgi:hypothetical protein
MDIPIIGPAIGSPAAAARWITARCSPSYTAFDVAAIVARYRWAVPGVGYGARIANLAAWMRRA